jgi:sterol desaturase/sphingolipid hydroxylase (fatty acid hydroxylase superfamily)
MLISAWVWPMALLAPVPLTVLMVLQGIGLANNIMSHLGYELLPTWWVRVPGLRWTNSATFHSMHHTGFKGNYGLFTRLWDRWLGTELPGYEATFEAAHARRPADPTLSPEAKGP